MQNRSTPLNGKRLIEQGYRVLSDDIGKVLQTPSGAILDLFGRVDGLGLRRIVWALECVTAIESVRSDDNDARAALSSKRRAKQPGDRLDIKGRTFTTQPVRNRLI